MNFGVIDLARDETGLIETALAMYAPDAVCLYREPIGEGLRRAAPYLAPLAPGSPLARFWGEHGWGSAWGIIVRSDESIEKLRQHLRKFLVVVLPDGDRALFRFYDPRVLPDYLRSCNRTELGSWFRAVTSFRIESVGPKAYTDFSFDGRELVET